MNRFHVIVKGTSLNIALYSLAIKCVYLDTIHIVSLVYFVFGDRIVLSCCFLALAF